MVDGYDASQERMADAASLNSDVGAVSNLPNTRPDDSGSPGSPVTNTANSNARQLIYSEPANDASNKYSKHYTRDRVLTRLPEKISDDFLMMSDQLKQYDSLIAHLIYMGFDAPNEASDFFISHQESIVLSFGINYIS